VAEHLGRDAEPADRLLQRHPHRHRPRQRGQQRRRLQRPGEHPRRHQPGEVAVDRHRELRRLGRGRERVDQLHGVLRLGVGEVERLPVAAGQVREVVHRLGHVVDRHHVGVAEVDADQRDPRRHGVAQPLEHREEVVGAVDLVHRAGLGVPDHDHRAVDAPRHGRLLAHDALGLVLGAVVRRGQPLPLVEHGLVEHAAVVAGHRDRGDVVEAPGLEGGGELEGRAGATDVELLVHLVGRGHVVDRGQVEEVLDLAGVGRDPLVADPEPLGLEVAHDRRHPVCVPLPHQRVELRLGPLADEHEDLTLTVVDELLDEVPSDESGRTGDEVGHARGA
jgi:hypothetical protein